ncbi:MAG: hypothetical protein ACP2W7_02290 [Buchnera aphidicola (Tetraneura sorini)]
MLDIPVDEDCYENTYQILTIVDFDLIVVNFLKVVEFCTKKLMEYYLIMFFILTFIDKINSKGINIIFY